MEKFADGGQYLIYKHVGSCSEEQIQEAVKAFGSVLEDDYSHLKDLSSKRGSLQKPEPCDRCGRVK